MSNKYFKNIDPAFKDNFEIKKIADGSLEKGPLLKKDWVIEKLKTFEIYASPWDLINFFYSLPHKENQYQSDYQLNIFH